jgi:hypothetical protein
MSEPPKKVLSVEKLKQLEIARAKANEVRKANAELKHKEKMIKTIEHEERKQQVETKFKELAKPKVEEPVVVRKPKKEKKIVYVEESSSDDEPEVVYIKKKKPPRQEPRQEPEVESMLTPAPPFEEQMSQAQIKAEMAKMRREMAKKMLFRPY